MDLAKAGRASNEAVEGPPKLGVTSVQLKALTQYTQGLVSQYRGLVELKNISAAEREDKRRWKAPMVERLDEYDDNVDLKRLVVYPPELQPIPIKPLFLDLAWNYIEYPGRGTSPGTNDAADGAASKRPTEEKKETRGWFRFGR